MTLRKIAPFSLVGITLLAIIGYFSWSFVAFGNVSRLNTPCQTASATTSVNYLTPGNATTTLTCDIYSAGQTTLADIANIKIQQAGSSTAAVLAVDVQYSQDGVDWYAVPQAGLDAYATTSPTNLGSVQQGLMTFASSTINRGAVTNVNSATTTRIFTIKTPTRYVRTVFSAPPGSTNEAFWAEIVPQKQQQGN